MRVRSVMKREFVKVGPDATLAEIVAKFYPFEGDWAPVCDGSQLVGMIRYDDVAVRAGKNGSLPATRARDLLSEDICFCFENTRLSEAAALMNDSHVSSLPVVTAAGELIGIVTREDIPDPALLSEE